MYKTSTVRKTSLYPKVLPKPKEKRMFSNFMVTISTNVNPIKQKWEEEEFEEFQERFTQVLARMFANPNEEPTGRLNEVVKYTDSTETLDKESFKEIVYKTHSSSVIEIGPSKSGGRIHSHSIIELEHNSKLHLDKPSIHDIVKEALAPECKNPWVRIKFITDSGKWATQYIMKDQPPLEYEDYAKLADDLR